MALPSDHLYKRQVLLLNRRNKFLSFLCVFLLFSVVNTAAVELKPDHPNIELTESLDYFEEIGPVLDPTEINRHYREYDWQKVPERNFRLAGSIRSHWLSTTVLTPGVSADWIITVEYSILPVISLWIFDGERLVASSEMGANLPFSARSMAITDFSVPVHLEANKEYRLLYRITTFGPIEFPLSIASANKHLESQSVDQWKVGFYYGIAIVMILYNLMIFLYNREWSYLVYIVLVGSVAMVGATLDGVGFQYFWPDYPTFNYSAYSLFSTLSQVSTTVFAILFLGVQQYSQRLYRLLTIFALLNGCAVLGVLFLNAEIAYILASLSNQVTIPVLLFAGGYMWYQGEVYARYFTTAWFAICSFSFFAVFVGLGFSDINISELTDYFRVASIVEMMLLALGLAKRIEELTRNQERALIESQAKSQFIAQVSHELRTPMNGVLGMSALLRDHVKTKQARHYNNVIYQSGLALLSTINDVLDAANIDADKLEVEKIPFNLRDLSKQALNIIEPQAIAKSLNIELELENSLPTTVLGDPNRIRQILLNFLSNAEKFTDTGAITLKVVPVSVDIIRFSVIDTGKGIPPEDLQALFSPYAQHKSNVSSDKGTGLGLFICKRIADIMDGDIGVTSKPDRGSSFWLELPLPETLEVATPLTGETSEYALTEDRFPRPLSILVAEDIPTNQLVIENILKKFGHRVDLVANGQLAVDQFKRDPGAYDIVLMDCEMPELSGYDASLQIRQFEEQNQLQATPIVALTAHALKESRDRCFQSGMNEVITKPVKILTLQAALKRFSEI